MANRQKKKAKPRPPQRPSIQKQRPKGGENKVVLSKSAGEKERFHSTTLPFGPADDVLLVGGDLSFSLSLLSNHSDQFHRLLATVFESREELLSKFSAAEQNIHALLQDSSMDVNETASARSYDESPTAVESDGEGKEPAMESSGTINVLYGVDATKLSKTKQIRTHKWDRIIFNFPHIGGKSTDTRRQIRHNQQLLLEFFTSAAPLLSTRQDRIQRLREVGLDADEAASSPSSILVTLFDGDPYSLWNIRDLARHAGLSVRRSFRFESRLFPGYQHSRTFGDVLRKDDRGEQRVQEEGVGRGAWKGEDRPARTYEFIVAEEKRKGKERHGKRKRGDSSDDER